MPATSTRTLRALSRWLAIGALGTLGTVAAARRVSASHEAGERWLLDADRAPPLGLPDALPEPADNAFHAARFELGRALFFDVRLSADGSVSCASCHRPEQCFADDQPTSAGVHGARTERNTPSLLNRGFGTRFMWDARSTSLEEQVLLPIENPREMGLALQDALLRVNADAELAARFEQAFGAPADAHNLGQALAQYVRRLVVADSPIDRFRAGDFDALDGEERVGLWVYESKGRCWRCHSGPNFSDEALHATGIGALEGALAPGRMAFSGVEGERGLFKTPTLRGVAHTAPYMHDGSLATLEDVVAYYRRGGNRAPGLAEAIAPIDMSDREAAALVAFLRALSRSGAAEEGRPERDPVVR